MIFCCFSIRRYTLVNLSTLCVSHFNISAYMLADSHFYYISKQIYWEQLLLLVSVSW